MRTIYIPHLPVRPDPVVGGDVPVFDLTPAERFGKLFPVVKAAHFSTTQLQQVEEALQNSSPDDLILAAGDIFALSQAIITCVALHGRANVLRYDKQLRAYNEEHFPPQETRND